MLKPIVDSRLLVGPETMDDAAVVQLSADLAIVLTTDFITPVVDDPLDWGWIAAANSISDIFAMGARPIAALNILAWSKCLPQEMLGDVLIGGQAAAEAAGCMIVGGHTVEDKEPKYGLAVFGTVHPDRILRNRGAHAGDILFLSKALGAGAVTTAMKLDAASPEEIEAVVQSMRGINRGACEAALAASVRAMTDVTGFGLAGHLIEMLGPEGLLVRGCAPRRCRCCPWRWSISTKGAVPAGPSATGWPIGRASAPRSTCRRPWSRSSTTRKPPADC